MWAQPASPASWLPNAPGSIPRDPLLSQVAVDLQPDQARTVVITATRALQGPDRRRDEGAYRRRARPSSHGQSLAEYMVIGNIQLLAKRGGKSGDWLQGDKSDE